MYKRALIVLAIIVATGYMVKLCFDGMNSSSDLGYVGGILGLAAWIGLITFILKYTFKNTKHLESLQNRHKNKNE